MTRYRILQHRNVWSIQKFSHETGRWVTLGRAFDSHSAELAGRAVDAMVAMDLLRKEAQHVVG